MLSTPGFATRRHQSVTGFIELSYSDGKVLAWGRIGCLGPDVRTVGEVKVEEPALAVPRTLLWAFLARRQRSHLRRRAGAALSVHVPPGHTQLLGAPPKGAQRASTHWPCPIGPMSYVIARVVLLDSRLLQTGRTAARICRVVWMESLSSDLFCLAFRSVGEVL